MRRYAVVLAVAGLVTVAFAGLALRKDLVKLDGVAPEQATQLPQQTEHTVAAKPATRLPPVASSVRPVAPEIVATPPIELDTLERAEARGPLSEIGSDRSPSEGPPAETILFRPLATGGGMFQSLGYEVELAGIQPTDAGETCVSDGVSWPCGIHARTAFRNWLRGRALTCVVPRVPTGELVVSKCMLGKQDAAAWLVAYGWARAVHDGAYAGLEDQARVARRGLFGPAPAIPATSDLPASEAEQAQVAGQPEPEAPATGPLVSDPLPDVFGLSGD